MDTYFPECGLSREEFRVCNQWRRIGLKRGLKGLPEFDLSGLRDGAVSAGLRRAFYLTGHLEADWKRGGKK